MPYTNSESALVDEILEKKKLGQETADLENKIDAMVYRFYDLTDEEIAIVEDETGDQIKLEKLMFG